MVVVLSPIEPNSHANPSPLFSCISMHFSLWLFHTIPIIGAIDGERHYDGVSLSSVVVMRHTMVMSRVELAR